MAGFVDGLLRRRRPPRFSATDEERQAMEAAAGMAAMRPGADLPDPAFIEGLRRRLAGEFDEESPTPLRATRRRMLQAAGLGLAAALVGGVLGQAADKLPTAVPEASIVPPHGSWRPVLPVAELPVGRAMAYSTQAMEVLIVNDRGTVRALSAVCTHLGCRLAPDPSAAQIDCPCHRTAFAYDGTVLMHELPVAPPRLPAVLSRVRGGTIELFLV